MRKLLPAERPRWYGLKRIPNMSIKNAAIPPKPSTLPTVGLIEILRKPGMESPALPSTKLKIHAQYPSAISS